MTDTTTPDEAELAELAFDESSRGQYEHPRRRPPDPARWVQPLPPELAERLPADALAEHERLCGRYAEEQAAAAELEHKLEQARAADTERERKAIVAGRKAPEPSAAKVEAELGQVQHRADVLAEEMALSAARLLALSAPHLADVIAEADALVESELDALVPLLDKIDEHLARRARAAGGARWVRRLADRRHTRPWNEQPDTDGSLEGNLGALRATLHTLREQQRARGAFTTQTGMTYRPRGPRREVAAEPAEPELDAG